ncbi:hypothetical protein [Psychrobacter sp. WY6]|uniref:hypothetical protein n=1 Tax=Psychrobacter sp. WY6 TaxID=2708350 RepID=UPI0020231117|nr:hypothetical protein [Psychrobacter sp. WY6]
MRIIGALTTDMGGGAGSGMTTGDAEASSSEVASSKGLSAAGFSAVSIPNAE